MLVGDVLESGCLNCVFQDVFVHSKGCGAHTLGSQRIEFEPGIEGDLELGTHPIEVEGAQRPGRGHVVRGRGHSFDFPGSYLGIDGIQPAGEDGHVYPGLLAGAGVEPRRLGSCRSGETERCCLFTAPLGTLERGPCGEDRCQRHQDCGDQFDAIGHTEDEFLVAHFGHEESNLALNADQALSTPASSSFQLATNFSTPSSSRVCTTSS